MCAKIYQFTCDYFYKDRSKADGLSKTCKTCGREKRSQYYKKNADKVKQIARDKRKTPEAKQRIKEQNAKYRAEHKEELKEYAREYYRVYNQIPYVKEANRKAVMKHKNANREKINKAHAERAKKNPEKHRAKQARRRARLLSIGIEKFTVQQVLDKTNSFCGYCGKLLTIKTFHMDHMVPVCRGGAHTLSNMIASCSPCNLRKNKRTYDEYMAIILASRASSVPAAAAAS